MYIYTYIYICIYMCVCVYVCVYIYIYICTHIHMHTRINQYIYIHTYLYMYVSLSLYIYIYIYIYAHVESSSPNLDGFMTAHKVVGRELDWLRRQFRIRTFEAPRRLEPFHRLEYRLMLVICQNKFVICFLLDIPMMGVPFQTKSIDK